MDKKCLMCGTNFTPHRGKNKANLYCSKNCFWEYRRQHPEAYSTANCICRKCGKEFYRRPAYLKKYGKDGLYCSLKCMKGTPFKCLVCSKEFHRKPSQVLDGAGKFCSRECKHINQRQGIEITGESYQQRHLIRQSSEYKSFRLAAKKLRGNKCQKCGVQDKSVCKCCGTIIYLHVNHIKPFATYPKLRFDPSNSSVLCPKCHGDLDKNTGRIAGTAQVANQQPSQEISNRLLEGSTVRTDESIMSTSTPTRK